MYQNNLKISLHLKKRKKFKFNVYGKKMNN